MQKFTIGIETSPGWVDLSEEKIMDILLDYSGIQSAVADEVPCSKPEPGPDFWAAIQPYEATIKAVYSTEVEALREGLRLMVEEGYSNIQVKGMKWGETP